MFKLFCRFCRRGCPYFSGQSLSKFGSLCGQGLRCLLLWTRAFGLRCCCFFYFFFCVFHILVVFLFFTGFLGTTFSFFLSCCLCNLFLSAARASDVYCFGQVYLVCYVTVFFFFDVLPSLLTFSFFFCRLHALKNTSCSHI